MKNILIAGKGSYIGAAITGTLGKEPDLYRTDTVDMIGDERNKIDLSVYDTVIFVAGIVHVKETSQNRELYYKVNCDLAEEFARRAKDAGVGQFIYFSTMSVYGKNTGVITAFTPPAPESNYGRSKYAAENRLNELADDTFRVAIIRPPMVYGPGCKGNYRLLSKLAKTSPIFPAAGNRRSMIYIGNLCICVRDLIDRNASGIVCPQNAEYVSTREMVSDIAACAGHKIKFVPLVGELLRACPLALTEKVLGDLTYDMSMQPQCLTKGNLPEEYKDLGESIRITESGE